MKQNQGGGGLPDIKFKKVHTSTLIRNFLLKHNFILYNSSQLLNTQLCKVGTKPRRRRDRLCIKPDNDPHHFTCRLLIDRSSTTSMGLYSLGSHPSTSVRQDSLSAPPLPILAIPGGLLGIVASAWYSPESMGVNVWSSPKMFSWKE